MSKIKTSADELVTNIIGANKSTEKVNDTNVFNYKGKKRMRKVERKDDRPLKNLSIGVSVETYQRLQRYITDEKCKGNTGVGVSDIGRTLIEKWVEENCPKA